jgi:D-lactate dehydrogenase
MDYLCHMVCDLEGSLKAEHGTGRNVAPYVELEWGGKATEVMWELKRLFDPSSLLNPGVVLNEDPKVPTPHLQRLKPKP